MSLKTQEIIISRPGQAKTRKAEGSNVPTNPYDLAVSTSLFCWGKYPWPINLFQNIKLIKEAGISWIELWYNSCPDHFDYMNAACTLRLRNILKENGIRVWSGHIRHEPVEKHGLDCIDEAPRKTAVEKAIAQIEHLLKIDGKVAVLHPGGFRWDKKLEKVRIEKTAQSMKEITRKFADRPNILFALENLNYGEDFCKISTLKTLIDKLNNPRIGICLDTGHANLQGDVAETINLLGNRIFTWHFSDNNGKDDSHSLPFSGNINWHNVLKAAVQIGYTGPLVMELYKHNNPQKMLNALIKMKGNFLCH